MVSRRNSRRSNRLIPINERKVILKRKSDLKSRSENNRGKSDEKGQTTNRFFLKKTARKTRRRRRTSGGARLRLAAAAGGRGGGGAGAGAGLGLGFRAAGLSGPGQRLIKASAGGVLAEYGP